MRRLLAIIMAIALCFTMPYIYAEADSVISDEDRIKIIGALRDMEYENSLLGSDFNSAEISIGSPIYIYEYSGGEFHNIRHAYPLFNSTGLIALAVYGDNGLYQIGTYLSDAIKTLNVDRVAIVYGRDGCYIYNGSEFICIHKYPNADENRDYILYDNGNTNVENILLCSLTKLELLGYSPSITSREQTYYSCNVVAVSQGTYVNLCWAACVASIVNTLYGTELRAINVAISKFGSSDYNRSLSIIDATTFMNSTYNTSYTNLTGAAPDDIILRNIQAGYPVFAGFSPSPSEIGHAVLIRGINLVSGYIVFMNPESGGVGMCYSDSGTYSYYDEATGKTYYYTTASCQYWTAE